MQTKPKPKTRRFNLLNMIVALVVAVFGWFYVVYNIDTTITKSYTVPLILEGHEQLFDNGYAVSEASVKEVNVVLEYKRTDLLSVNKENIVATADVSNCTQGVNTIDIDILAPRKATVIEQSYDSVDINILDGFSKEVELRVSPSAMEEGEPEPIVENLDIDTVSVIGTEDMIKKLRYSDIYFDPSNISENQTSQLVTPCPRDKNGNEIEYAYVLNRNLSVIVWMGTTKLVPLKASLSHEDNYNKYSINSPQQILIKGRAVDLKNIDSIKASDIDLRPIFETTEVTPEIDLPDNVYLSNRSKNIKFKVTVK